MRDENERREYVLSQNGLIFQGTCDYIFSIPWNFGQVSGQGPLGPLADPGHAALVLQDTGTGAVCVRLANMVSAPWSLAMGQGNQNLVSKRQCADFKAWQGKGSVSPRLLGAPWPCVPNLGGSAVPGGGA